MDGVTILLIAAGLLAVLILLIIAVGLLHGPAAFYVRRDELFSPEQSEMLQRLDQALAHHYRIFPKIGLPEVVGLKRRMSGRTRRLAWNRIAGDHFDYLLTDKQTLEPVAAVLLTDETPSRKDRRRLVFLRKVCKAIGLPLIELNPDSIPADPDDLADDIEQAVSAISQAAGSFRHRQEPALSGH